MKGGGGGEWTWGVKGGGRGEWTWGVDVGSGGGITIFEMCY